MPQFKIHPSSSHKICGVKGLGQTGKSYCEEWIKEQLYGRKKEFTSKYTEKGLSQEDAAIRFAAEHFGWGEVAKNVRQYENEFMIGTPDIILPGSVEDVKCSWDCFTFPLLDTEPDRNYILQLQCYMELTGLDVAGLVYTLMDTPDNIVESEARKVSYKAGFDELSAELYDEVKLSMSYSHLPVEQRVKRFEIKRDGGLIDTIQSRVIECREYIESVCPGVLEPVHQ